MRFFNEQFNVGKNTAEVIRSLEGTLSELVRARVDCVYFQIMKTQVHSPLLKIDTVNRIIIEAGIKDSETAFRVSPSDLAIEYEKTVERIVKQALTDDPLLKTKLKNFVEEELEKCQERLVIENKRLHECLCELVKFNDIQQIVISIGCYDSETQKLPPFIKNKPNTLVINIDLIMVNQVERLGENAFHVMIGMFMSDMIQARNASSKNENGVILTKFIEVMLNTGKQICIIDSRNTCSTIGNFPLFQEHINQYDKQLVVIQSYIEALPVIRFHREFFEQVQDGYSRQKILDQFYSKADRKWQAEYKHESCTEEPVFPPNLGTIYGSLADIASTDVFIEGQYEARIK